MTAPEGYAWTWVPAAEVPSADGWVVLGPDEEREPCRYTVGPRQKTCGQPSAVRLNRSTDRNRPRWWHYCAEHLYGKELRNGVLYVRVLTPTGGTP